LNHGIYAVVVEAHAVDDALVFGNAEEARLRVAGLRLTGDGADLDVAEADTSQRGNALTALVEACSQAERRGESNAHNGGCQFGGGLEVLAQGAGDADVAQGLNAPEADVVCLLGVHALEEDVEEESSEETSGYQALASLLMSDTDEYEDVEDDTDEE